MSLAQTLRGPILNPRADGTVDFIPDGAIACDDRGTITHIGPAPAAGPTLASSRQTAALILPPFLDAHTHVPQHPIRGHFMDGVEPNAPEGRLIAGLNRNVFPAEARCADANPAESVVRAFRCDTLAQGVIGGAVYMTVHPAAARIALVGLAGGAWSVGLVMMNMNCPAYLRTREETFERDVDDLARSFGSSLIMTDRFAVAVSSDLRRRGVALANKWRLRTQTHLNEQLGEKRFVEQQLYPHRKSYTDVYHADGLLDHDAILAHCIHMRPDELDLIARKRCAVAHCPTSNTLLASGIMPLDEIVSRNIDYAICTDVGASPTTSMLAEMAQYLKVHACRSARATPAEALYRSTLAPAKILGLDRSVGTFEVGGPMSFIEVEPAVRDAGEFSSADDAILRGLLGLTGAELSSPARLKVLDKLQAAQLDAGPELELLERDVRATAARLEHRVISVTVGGQEVFRRTETGAV